MIGEDERVLVVGSIFWGNVNEIFTLSSAMLAIEGEILGVAWRERGVKATARATQGKTGEIFLIMDNKI